MKKLLGVVLVLALAAPAMAQHAVCVGGPRAPSYAFTNYGEAQACANQIAAFGNDCARFVQVGECTTSWQNINSVCSAECRCNPGFWIGQWGCRDGETCSVEAQD